MHQQRTWRTVEYLLYGILALTPLFFYQGHRYPFVTGKVSLMTTGILGMLVAALFIYKRGREPLAVHVTRLHWVLAFFVLLLVVSGMFGVSAHQSFFGTFERGMGVVLMLLLAAYSVVVAELVRKSPSVRRRIMTAIFWPGLIVAGLVYLGPGGTGTPLFETIANNGATLGNSSLAGAYLVFVVFCGIYLFLTEAQKKLRIATAIATVLVLACPLFLNFNILKGSDSAGDILRNPVLIAGEARGALLGLVVGIVLILLLRFIPALRRSIRLLGWAAIILLIGGIVALTVPGIRTGLFATLEDKSLSNREVFLDIGLQGIAERPVLGWGFQNYASVYQKYFDARVLESGYFFELWVDQPHNILVEYAIAAGILGLLAYLVLFLATTGGFLQKTALQGEADERTYAIIAGSLMVAYFLQNLFLFDHPVTMLLFFTFIGCAMGMLPVTKAFALTERSKPFTRKAWAAGGTLACIVLFIILAMLPWREASAWLQFINKTSVVERPELRPSLQSISPVGTIDDSSQVAHGFLRPLRASFERATPEQRHALIKEAQSIAADLEEGIRRSPDHVRSHYLAGRYESLLYVLKGGTDRSHLEKSREHLMQAATLSPHNPYFSIELAYTEFLAGNEEKGMRYAQQAIEQAPGHPDTYDLLENIAAETRNKTLEAYLKQVREEPKAP